MPNGIVLVIIAIITLVLIGIYGACKVSGSCSRKEEQEEAKRKLKGQEQKLDDNNWLDDLVYDNDFVKKGGRKNERITKIIKHKKD